MQFLAKPGWVIFFGFVAFGLTGGSVWWVWLSIENEWGPGAAISSVVLMLSIGSMVYPSLKAGEMKRSEDQERMLVEFRSALFEFRSASERRTDEHAVMVAEFRAAEERRSLDQAKLLAEFREANKQQREADEKRSEEQAAMLAEFQETNKQQMEQMTRLIGVAEELTEAIKSHSPVSSDPY